MDSLSTQEAQLRMASTALLPSRSGSTSLAFFFISTFRGGPRPPTKRSLRYIPSAFNQGTVLMAEALVALGALSSAFQVLDFSGKLASHAYTLTKAGNDALRENIETERLAQMYKSLAESIHLSRHNAPQDPGSKGPSGPVSETEQVWRIARELLMEANELLKELEDLRVTATSKLKRIREGTKQAARYLKKKSDLDKRRKRLSDLNGLLSTALLQVRVVERRTASVLKTLAFDGVQFREGSILDAYPKTYVWALNDNKFGLKSRLEKGDGMFWVTGKAGSGKSTFMKFLYGSQKTSDLLRTWASGSQLVVARFYFWYLGTSIQKSVEGLLRSLLYQIIERHPERAMAACPEYFAAPKAREKEVRDSTGQVFIVPDSTPSLKDLHWTQEKLMEALQRIASSARNQHSTKFCFFVDGLDEYSGIHSQLIQLLRVLSKNTGIKICVSSRPWSVFTRAFEGSHTPQLLLEVLTKGDIRQYVEGHIKSALAMSSPSCTPIESRPPNSQSTNGIDPDTKLLIEDIVERAEGVFLWVYLVVKSVLSGLDEGDTIGMLQHRVVKFPPDLEAFFKTLIFDRVDTVYASQTCQALTLAFKCAESGDAVLKIDSFIHYWMISQGFQGFDNPRSAFDQPIVSLTQESMDKMAERTRSFLSASCRDLLLLERTVPYRHSTKVTFLHRTVYDFLCTEQMQETMRSQCPAMFRTEQVFHLLNLAKVKYLRHDDPEMASCLSEYANFSLAVEGLSSDFVKQFVSAMSAHDECATYEQNPLSTPCRLSPEAVTTLVAFGEMKIGSSPFHSADAFAKWVAALDTDLSSLTIAALGDSPQNRFGFSAVNLDLVKELFKYDQLVRGQTASSGDPSSCSFALWRDFLIKLAEGYKQLARSIETDEQLATGCFIGWEIAKIFMACGAPQDHSISQLRQFMPGNHSYVAAIDLFNAYVPQDWLQEWRSKEASSLRHTYLQARVRNMSRPVPEQEETRQPFVARSVLRRT